MSGFPGKPFLTKDFSSRGGGVDFLGLRLVNLNMVGHYLIPEINNQTQDMGTFCLGAWMPWKFMELCRSKADCTEPNYRRFREKVEVAMSQTFHVSTSVDAKVGPTRNRVGITQKIKLPSKLTFNNAGRKSGNSIYSAAIYGPSIRYLGLIDSYTILADDGFTPIRVPKHSDDDGTMKIVETVDAALEQTSAFKRLASLDSETMSQKDVESLSECGLNPAYWRLPRYKALKEVFRQKLLPDDASAPGYGRTLTTKLVLATVKKRKITSWELRTAWFTGMYDDGKPLLITDAELEEQKNRWSLFLARQYQRYAIETFLYCFEIALKNGCRSIEAVVDFWLKGPNAKKVVWQTTFDEILLAEAKKITGSRDDDTISHAWNEKVHPGHSSFEEPDDLDQYLASPCLPACQLLAKWFWRMLVRVKQDKNRTIVRLGDSDRMSMAWFIDWLQARRSLPLEAFLKDVFSDLVFAQHMRVALSRFDGQAQRLRFMLSDRGIEPAIGARNIGEMRPPWMPDRLDTLINLLEDTEVLVRSANDELGAGDAASEI